MNIKEAKDYIKNSVQIYLKKDEFGEVRVRQDQTAAAVLAAAQAGSLAVCWKMTVIIP